MTRVSELASIPSHETLLGQASSNRRSGRATPESETIVVTVDFDRIVARIAERNFAGGAVDG